MRVAIDADVLVYKAGFVTEPVAYAAYYKGKFLMRFNSAAEHKVWLKRQPESKQGDFTREKITELKDFSVAKEVVDGMFYSIRKYTNARQCDAFLTSDDKSNFRFDLATILPYKGTRKADKPVYYHEIREYIQDRYKAEVIHGEEADDALAQYQFPHWRRLISGNCSDHDVTCIASIDKDLLMVPGYHYNFDKGHMQYVSIEQGVKTFYMQLLKGDKSVDNIPGLYHCTGKKMVAGIKAKMSSLKTSKEMYDYALELYGDADTVLEIGNLLFMRPYRGMEWTPPV